MDSNVDTAKEDDTYRDVEDNTDTPDNNIVPLTQNADTQQTPPQIQPIISTTESKADDDMNDHIHESAIAMDPDKQAKQKLIKMGSAQSSSSYYDVYLDEAHANADLNVQYSQFIQHLKHAASYKAEFDIYQVLAFRARIDSKYNQYLKPFKMLKGLVDDKYSEMEIRWLNSFQRVLCQALITGCIQTLGVTAILVTQFATYFHNDESQCDYQASKWKEHYHLKILAFMWTAFISLGVSGWVYRARHSGFYHMFNFLPPTNYPTFVSIHWLQIGLMINYYVVTSAVVGSYILIYQTEGGQETINMILQAVALFFVLELDNKIVHARDFRRIVLHMDRLIKKGEHLKLPSPTARATNSDTLKSGESVLHKPIQCCNNRTCMQTALAVLSWILLVVMSVCSLCAPFAVLICW